MHSCGQIPYGSRVDWKPRFRSREATVRIGCLLGASLDWRGSPSVVVGDVSNLKNLSKTRYCGTGAAVIQTDEQMLLAQQCISNLRTVLLEARKVHSSQDYMRMAEPILLEVQQREQEILEYLTRDLEQPVAN
jgi:hypothetical protein